MSIQTSTTEIDFPETGFIDEYGFYMKRRPSVTLAVEREVVDPILIRNSDEDRAETQEFKGTTRAQSNPEKFVAKERLTGLDLLRELDEDEELISENYAYNEPPKLKEAINMDALTYGLAGTGSQDYGMKSRLFAGYTYTLGPYENVNPETRNSVYESGTMTDDEGDHSQALYGQIRVQPGNEFIHFLTIEAGTPAMLAYVMHNILNTYGYGARETRSGKTIQNNIRAIVLAENPVLLSVGEFITNHDPKPESSAVGNALGNYISAHRQAGWEVYGDGDVPGTADFPEWFTTLKAVANRQRERSKEVLAEMFTADTKAAKHSEDGIPGYDG